MIISNYYWCFKSAVPPRICDDMLNDGSVSKSGSNRKVKQYTPLITQAVKMGGGDKNNEPSDKGTNSRYYSLDLWFNKMVDEL